MYIPYAGIQVRGELSHRLLINYARLESRHYRPEKIFSMDSGGWPGDWIGRTMLALVELGEVTHKEPSYLEQILDGLPKHWNKKGYLGRVLNAGEFDEQQLSGHNWLLRALLEYASWKGNTKVVPMVQNILRSLYLPLRGHYRTYPILREDRSYMGKYTGKIAGKRNGWYTSTDIGCAFICLDALAQAYGLFRTPELRELIEEMIDVFLQINYVRLSMQTHATLSATRGIITYYQLTKEERCLALAKRVFKLYIQSGMTANYANENWFNRPSWTEPCAIVDSLMCATELFKITGDAAYLETAQKIYYNGLGHAQRPNGGFGLDVCCNESNRFIKHSGKGMCEAYWCCTMRGAEGLAYFTHNQVLYDEGCFRFLHYCDMDVRYRDISIREITQYPKEGTVRLKIENPKRKKVGLAFFIPSYVTRIHLRMHGKERPARVDRQFLLVETEAMEEIVGVRFDIPLIKEPVGAGNSGAVSLFHGFLMLGADTDKDLEIDPAAEGRYADGKFHIEGLDIPVGRIDNVMDMEIGEVERESRQIVFPLKRPEDG